VWVFPPNQPTAEPRRHGHQVIAKGQERILIPRTRPNSPAEKRDGTLPPWDDLLVVTSCGFPHSFLGMIINRSFASRVRIYTFFPFASPFPQARGPLGGFSRLRASHIPCAHAISFFLARLTACYTLTMITSGANIKALHISCLAPPSFHGRCHYHSLRKSLWHEFELRRKCCSEIEWCVGSSSCVSSHASTVPHILCPFIPLRPELNVNSPPLSQSNQLTAILGLSSHTH
jgi:hypothetical protein